MLKRFLFLFFALQSLSAIPISSSFRDYSGPFSTQMTGVIYCLSILPPSFESKSGSKEPKNRQKRNSQTDSQSIAYEPAPFALFTIPKSGSHLLIKTLHFMTDLTPFWHTEPPPFDLLKQKQFPYTHCCLSPKLLTYYSDSPIKQIIGVRDLRDICVSIVYQIRKGLWPEFTNNVKKISEFERLSFDEQLLFVIHQNYELGPYATIQLGIEKVAAQAVFLIQDQTRFVCRYEDLVGPRGGGSLEAQREMLERLALYLGIFLSPAEIEELSFRLYGDEENPFGQSAFSNYQSTFREGKIGSWKTAFKEIHKEAFKQKLGEALIALGYEKNNNW